MASEKNYELCMALIKADSEEEVIEILDKAGYWNDEEVWRFYGDYENNYNQIGNQQSKADAALVEKLVNSVDARLMNECMRGGINPESTKAPRSIKEAVAQFIRGIERRGANYSGSVTSWTESERTAEAKNITLCATGFKPSDGSPCLTITDSGEGQTPLEMPNTFLSLNRSNKVRIPFVQGKFNMGGTGALKFCGRQNLQLIVSKRNPEFLSQRQRKDGDDSWGFTVVRRENPPAGSKSSFYTYLAPIDASRKPRQGDILRLRNDGLYIFPEKNRPYARRVKWGSLIKLYEYDMTGFKTHILRRGGLLPRLEILMPDVALPIRLHECRDYGGEKERSYDTNLTGIKVRLEDGRADNLEPGFPSSLTMNVGGESLTATIYVLKKGTEDTYKRSEGILFTINGQTHGYESEDFFRRKSVGMSYLADSLLIIIDCSGISARAREDLFLNSRDRLYDVELKRAILTELAELLKEHQGLRDLREKRRREEIENQLSDERPLESVLKSLLKNDPLLSSLFLTGNRISNPFRKKEVAKQEDFRGSRFPTYFRFRDKDYGYVLNRDAYLGRRCQVAFDTDANNDFFDREDERGHFELYMESDGTRKELTNHRITLHNGSAVLTLGIPTNSIVGDHLKLVAAVSNGGNGMTFENRIVLRINEPKPTNPTEKGNRKQPPSQEPGSGATESAGLALPNIVKVYEESFDGGKSWKDMSPPFDQYAALRVIHAGGGGDGADVATSSYDFFVNMDNIYLKSTLKNTKFDLEVTKARYVYALVIVGLGLLRRNGLSFEEKGEDDEIDSGSSSSLEELVYRVTKALAPILLPMIEKLGDLDASALEMAEEPPESDIGQ